MQVSFNSLSTQEEALKVKAKQVEMLQSACKMSARNNFSPTLLAASKKTEKVMSSSNADHSKMRKAAQMEGYASRQQSMSAQKQMSQYAADVDDDPVSSGSYRRTPSPVQGQKRSPSPVQLQRRSASPTNIASRPVSAAPNLPPPPQQMQQQMQQPPQQMQQQIRPPSPTSFQK